MKTKTILAFIGFLFVISSSLLAETPPATSFAGGSGTAIDPYQISNLAEWRRLSTTPSVHGSHFLVTADIDVKESNTWKTWGANPGVVSGIAPIGWNGAPFKGKIDGGGHKISNIFISRDNQGNMGIFGATLNAKIQNIIFDSVYVKGGWNSGILVGRSKGQDTISNVALTNIHFASSMNASLQGTQNIGGIIGASDGQAEVNGCIVSGKMDVNAASFGALIGIANYINIKDCFSDVIFNINIAPASTSDNITGLVARATFCNIAQSFSISSFTYENLSVLPKALIGENVKIGGVYSSQISNCKFNTDIVSPSILAVGNDSTPTGVSGLTSVQMSESLNFDGYDFNDVWDMSTWSGMSIPVQKWYNSNLTTVIEAKGSQKNEFWIYPNPVTNVIYVGGVDTFSNYKILSLEGRVLMEGLGGVVDVSELTKGIYFISYNQKVATRFLKL